MTINIDNHSHGACHRHSMNAGNKSGFVDGLRAPVGQPAGHLATDTDRVRLGSNTRIANIYIIVARGEIPAGTITLSDVVLASCASRGCAITIGNVVATGRVKKERT